MTDTQSLGITLDELMDIIKQRSRSAPDSSYTAAMLAGDVDALLKKIGEEATEVVMAAKDEDRAQLCYEAVDLLYHLLVTCERFEVTADDLAAEIRGRF
ncbi:MAG: phosphoribosyl-ATP diphosphatase [Coriobacteriia bacterium]|nr:phosphoribosyl-ATP diphosphatase [Coriobacteriia bacterium]